MCADAVYNTFFKSTPFSPLHLSFIVTIGEEERSVLSKEGRGERRNKETSGGIPVNTKPWQWLGLEKR